MPSPGEPGTRGPVSGHDRAHPRERRPRIRVLLALAAVRRNPLLSRPAVCAAVLYVLAGLAVAVARTFWPLKMITG